MYVHVRVEGKGTNGRFEKYCSLQVVAYENTSLIVHVKAAFPLEQLFCLILQGFVQDQAKGKIVNLFYKLLLKIPIKQAIQDG